MSDESLSFKDSEVVELFEITIPEEASAADMVKAGKYDEFSGHIASGSFPITYRGLRKLFLLRFNKAFHFLHVESLVKQMNDKELAGVGDLLALGAHPRHRRRGQLEFPITCLGSEAVIMGIREVPVLNKRSHERILDTWPVWGESPSSCRVLLVDRQKPLSA